MHVGSDVPGGKPHLELGEVEGDAADEAQVRDTIAASPGKQGPRGNRDPRVLGKESCGSLGVHSIPHVAIETAHAARFAYSLGDV